MIPSLSIFSSDLTETRTTQVSGLSATMTGRPVSSISSRSRSCFFFFKQKTAYEITYGYWSSDVCSSDLIQAGREPDPCNRFPDKAVLLEHVDPPAAWIRSEERRVGKECRRLCRSRWS